MNLQKISEVLSRELQALQFAAPVTHVYNPLAYAHRPYAAYLDRYGQRPKEIVLLGMNPGPWGMAQTGVPFGEIKAVRDWLGIEASVGTPAVMHPKRPILGFACERSEVSGKRLWGWARNTFGTPERFFARFFVANYCPLMFMEESGRNRTPDQLPATQRAPLLAVCDQAMRQTVQWLKPSHVIGVGNFAHKRAQIALSGIDVRIGKITHPSPANPRANQGWELVVREELLMMGIHL